MQRFGRLALGFSKMFENHCGRALQGLVQVLEAAQVAKGLPRLWRRV